MKGKKRILAVVLTICMLVSSFGAYSVIADSSAGEANADVVLSVTADKTDVKPGETVTLTVAIDRFKSTRTDDDTKYVEDSDMTIEGKSINTIEMHLMLGDAEYVKGSIVKKFYKPSYASSDNSVGLAIVKYGGEGDVDYIKETETKVPLFTVDVKIPETVKENTTYSFDFDSVVLKSMIAKDDYKVEIKNASVNVWGKTPTITLDDKEAAEVYTKKVTVNAKDADKVTVDGVEQKMPYVVSASGEHTVVAENKAGQTTVSFRIAPVVDGIKIESKPDKLSYVKGMQLDLTGGSIRAMLSNGEEKVIDMTDKDVVVEGYDATPEVYGEQIITVTYAGKKVTFTVNVKDKEITKIEWIEKPADSIIEGQSLATAIKDAKIKVFYDDGTDSELAVTEAMCSGYDETKAPQTLTVSVALGEKTLSFDLVVKKKSVTKIEMSQAIAKTEYIEKQQLDLTGGMLTVSYDNGKTEELALTAEGVKVTGYEAAPKTYGKQTLTVTYEGKTTEFTVSVREKAVSKTELVNAPVDAEIVEGGKLDLTGVQVKVIYDNGDTELVDVTEAMVSYANDVVGDAEVTVTYKDKAGNTFKNVFAIVVKAKAIKSFEVVSAPEQTVVLEGKELDLTGAKMNIVYDNGTVDENVAITEVKGFDNRTVGAQDVEVIYKGVNTGIKFTITVKEKSVSKVEIVKNEVTQIKEGKSFSFAGTLKVTYDNDDTENVSFSNVSVKVDATKVDTAKAGKYPVNVVYTAKSGKEYNLSYEVEVVEKELVSIKVSTKPSVTSIIEGTKLDVTDGKLTLVYDNDTTAEVAMSNDMVSGFDNQKIGTQTVTITYAGKTTTLDVTVAEKSVQKVTLVSAPDQKTVVEGLELNPAGGRIHIVYDNGSEEDKDITAGMLKWDNKTVGVQTVVVTYADKTVTFEVEVVAKKAVKLALNVEEKELIEGSKLEDAGIEVYYIYDNDTKEVLTLADVTVEGYDADKCGAQKVTFKYKEMEAVLTVYVVKNSEIAVDTDDEKSEHYIIANKDVNKEVVEKVVEALKTVIEKYEKYEVFDIQMLDKLTGLNVQPDGSVKVTLTIPSTFNLANKLTIYRLNDDGSMTKMDNQAVKDGKISFTTDHFSTYVIVEEKVETVTPDTEKETTATEEETTTAETKKEEGTSVKTGDVNQIAVLLVVIAIAGVGFVSVARRKEQN